MNTKSIEKYKSFIQSGLKDISPAQLLNIYRMVKIEMDKKGLEQ